MDPDGMTPVENGGDDRYTIKGKELTASNSAATIVSRFEPEKKSNGKDGPTGTDVVTETKTTTNTYNVTVYDSELEIYFSATQEEKVVTKTSTFVDRDGKVNKTEKNTTTTTSTVGLAPLARLYSNTTKTSVSSVLPSESELSYAHNSAVNYVSDTKKNTGFSPSQLNAQKEQSSLSSISYATAGIGGVMQQPAVGYWE